MDFKFNKKKKPQKKISIKIRRKEALFKVNKKITQTVMQAFLQTIGPLQKNSNQGFVCSSMMMKSVTILLWLLYCIEIEILEEFFLLY